jgi:methanogenic corrinoid protein MtbC1
MKNIVSRSDSPLAGPGDAANRGLGIAAVERDTGLAKDTLRVWERRYNFPQPHRDVNGERLYAPQEVEKLRLLKRLVDRGLRPGKIIGLETAELLLLAGQSAPGAADTAHCMVATREPTALLALLKAHQTEELRRALPEAAVRHGLGYFVSSIAAPLNGWVGDAWMRGEIEVFEEHLYAETMQAVLRQGIAALPRHGAAPRVLMTTLPGESHGLGLLMAEAMLALEGAHCISLGVQTPIRDIILAAVAQRAQVVALSFSGAYPTGQLADGLARLRAELPAEVEIWAGGSAAGLARHVVAGVRVVRALEAVRAEIAGWRSRQAGAQTVNA